MAKLILLRHLQSQWNKENKFTGWTDVLLSEEGIEKASIIADKLMAEPIDLVFTSPLVRNKNTAELVLKYLNRPDIADIKIDKAFDERNYGVWQGLDKGAVKQKYGEEEYRRLRRSWTGKPEGGESLQDVYERVVPYYKNAIEPELRAGKNCLVVASHNSLRALAKYLENIADEAIIDFEIPNGGVVIYELDESLQIKNKETR
ncbi:MAG: 2,3-bisphosphoglycerate-dependent phosphoglycerate mutase [Parcubacteria group bacterium GW2011_GWC1_43_11b]|uniref:phosphoglycerate mutase (2,3-diphosphoglycerate-dependent) n=2 Tax=Candidatus Vogeliibacteriota TaxID=1817922 RepID=A0A1G2QEM6_9BACT|nr:MAG: 2,3-bisphosphoglycerate-dependent phosphoglycerate mutase [Parcubacteria group bacterium GW2011_GWB1_42_9]KKS89256.1 MAG: 2,3-bisphosphoglycerate-dependent phosphoglycerate mutase [Parcubacteria group bacterium GW2011_GWC1_43_11b]KKT10126.1 MAG: 2,3-bisphosphoglycerate-dependent phosphoglycerate mutase [Parcubacteria group bacterium GW2011_GWA1_43_21]OHA59040.1 MAG: hypothetical protein A2370_00775 [Candidatus Vogelbacteria bacterium RIFOXYB1_FULL_42_16]OHA60001.1 MAG: hypothetical prot